MRRTTRASLFSLCVLASMFGVASASDPPGPEDVSELVAAYTRNPVRHRAALLALARRSDVELPPVVALMAGDAALRSGAGRTATRRFEHLIASGIQDPWLGWTRLALGWIALTREDVRAARVQFEEADSSPASRAAANLALALLTASERGAGAAAHFAAVENDASADPALREAAELGSAYERYWSGNHADARMAFLTLSDRRPASPLADDARYAAAWMAVHAGAWEEALEEITALAGGAPAAGRSEGTRRDLLNLEPRALMQAGIHRYRRGALAPPDRQLAKLLDGDGVRLARAALRWIGPLETAGATPRDPLTRPWPVQPIAAIDEGAEPPPAAAPARRPLAPVMEPATHGWRLNLAVLALVLVVVAAFVARREARPRT